VSRPEFGGTLATVGALIVVGGTLAAIAEHRQPGSTIANLGDGLWWALVTSTTAGYGDEYPVTFTGRIIATLLMIAGISGLSVITANVAAFFVSNDTEPDTDDLSDRLDRIEQALGRLLDQTDTGTAPETDGDPVP
jgi:voltage-gated potassium channel